MVRGHLGDDLERSPGFSNRLTSISVPLTVVSPQYCLIGNQTVLQTSKKSFQYGHYWYYQPLRRYQDLIRSDSNVLAYAVSEEKNYPFQHDNCSSFNFRVTESALGPSTTSIESQQEIHFQSVLDEIHDSILTFSTELEKVMNEIFGAVVSYVTSLNAIKTIPSTTSHHNLSQSAIHEGSGSQSLSSPTTSPSPFPFRDHSSYSSVLFFLNATD